MLRVLFLITEQGSFIISIYYHISMLISENIFGQQKGNFKEHAKIIYKTWSYPLSSFCQPELTFIDKSKLALVARS